MSCFLAFCRVELHRLPLFLLQGYLDLYLQLIISAAYREEWSKKAHIINIIIKKISSQFLNLIIEEWDDLVAPKFLADLVVEVHSRVVSGLSPGGGVMGGAGDDGLVLDAPNLLALWCGREDS